MSRSSSDFAVGLADLFHQFGEPLTYRPAHGSERSIRGIVTPVDEETEEGATVERSLDRVWITVRRDSTHATDGGIEFPESYDAIAVDGESEPIPYVYQGRKRNESPDAWDLQFGRDARSRIGPPHAP